MKLIVKIKAGKVVQEITLPVGNGTQTFKWLAFAAAYRIVQDGERHGGHHLTKKNDRYTFPMRTQLLPKDVYTEDCPFLHPDGIIKDHLTDGQTINVDLYTEQTLDEYGIPILSPWAFIAFRHGAQDEEKRGQLIEEKMLEVESFREERQTQAMIEKMNIERPKIRMMKQVMAPQLISDSTIAATLETEWEQIKNSGILDNVVPDQNQQEEIHQFFELYFVELNDMYKFYSAVNSGGGTHTLEYIELCKFLTETGILGEEHSNAILRIFIDSHIKSRKGKATRPSIHSEIYRYEFFVALIKIAILKNVTIPKKEASKLRRKGLHVSISRAKVPTAPEALEMMYQDFLSPVLKNMPAGSTMRAAVGSDSVMILLYDNLPSLIKCFEKYAESDLEGGTNNELSLDKENETLKTPNGSMTVQCFGKFAHDAGFVDSDVVVRRFSNHGRKHSIMGNRSSSTKDGKQSITQKDVRQIFAASQHDSDEPNETEQTKVDNDDNLSSHHELMIFSEFLEAICRLGVLKFHTHPTKEEAEEAKVGPEQEQEVLSHYECINLAVEQVLSNCW